MLRKKYTMFSTPRSRAVARISSDLGETVVQSGLAYTPADMQRMAERGVSITSQNMEGSYYYEPPTKDFDMPLMDTRGVDPADIWNAQMDARDKLNKSSKAAKAAKAAADTAQAGDS
uniref:Internal scaffolding protein n=1 Tax=Dulem virus 262 TaxID=3145739 RepID=A0AAU8B3U3_9VIRU